MKGWAVWLTGLPGSGKTTIAKELMKKFEKVEYLRMDEIRKILTPKREYTEKERDYAYRALVSIAKSLTDNGTNVIIDATAHRRVWRDLARDLMPNFVEVYVKCPLEICMTRESKREDNLVLRDLYKKALERMKSSKRIVGLGEVIGVDVEYEEPDKPELTIESDKLGSKESSEKIFQFLKLKFYKE